MDKLINNIRYDSDSDMMINRHCHIAWHASSGLALNIIERQDEIVGGLKMGSLDETREVCREWEEMGLEYQQEDSGI